MVAPTQTVAHASGSLMGLSRVWLPYDEYRVSSRPGDVLLWESRSVTGDAICWETDGVFCHASLQMSLFGRPCQAAYQEGLNGYISHLSGEVRRNSGKISVFRPFDPDTKRPFGPDVLDRVAFEMFNSLGGDYAWTNIGLIFGQRSLSWRVLSHMPWFGERIRQRWEREVKQQSRKRTSAICSQAVVRAWNKGAGLLLCDGKDESLVTPSDIGQGCKDAYIGTLVWPAKWKG